MPCPKCGSSRVSYELRAAGTNSKTNYYRTGIKSSWILPSGQRSYKSKKQYKSIGICHNCGYHWEQGSENQIITDGCIGRCFALIIYVSVWLALLVGYQTANDGKIFLALALIVLTAVPFVKPVKKLITQMRNRQKQSKDKLQTAAEQIPAPCAQTSTAPTPDSCPPYSDKIPTTQSLRARYANRYITDPKELVIEAGKIAQESGRLSTAPIQMCLRVGYGRAARIIDYLEAQGVIGLSDAEKEYRGYSFCMTDEQFQQWVETVERNAPPEL